MSDRRLSEEYKRPEKPPRKLVFWGLVCTGLCYGFIAFAVPVLVPGVLPPQSLVSLSLKVKLLIMAGITLVALPKTVWALWSTRKLALSIKESNADHGELAKKVFLCASGFEILCLLGLIAFMLGFSVLWVGIGLVAGSGCKLSYAPRFNAALKKFRGEESPK